MLAAYVPVILVCLVALFVTLGRWKQAPRASLWAALGFGLVLFLSVALPAVYMIVRNFVERGSTAQSMSLYTVIGMGGALLHALAYAMLLVAIYAGRQTGLNTTPPPPNPQ